MTVRVVRKIGIIGGKGSYGRLLHELIRRFALSVDVLIYDLNVEPDGRTYVTLKEIAECDAVILAVPMHAFAACLKELLAQPTLRPDTIFVDVCTDKQISGQLLRALAGDHPFICFHTLWGPEAYRSVGGAVALLEAIVVTDSNLAPETESALLAFVSECGFNISRRTATEHDDVIVGHDMYLSHLVAQVLIMMGTDLSVEPEATTASYRGLLRSARLVAGDSGIFLDLWLRHPACQKTFANFIAAVHMLERQKEDRAAK